MKDNVLNLMETIIGSELSQETPSLKRSIYNDQKQLIKNLFALTSHEKYNADAVMLRLTVIDSLYSTSAAFSHFAMEQMTKGIIDLGSEEKAKAYFYAIACGGKDSKELFNADYGYQRNKPAGVMQMSLLSKYASFSLLGEPSKYPWGFPIYDNMARTTYKLLCRALGIKPRNIGSENSEKASKKNNADADGLIEKYVAAFNEVREMLFGKAETLYHSKKTPFDIQQYDLLDTYLWRMGKIGDGSYSYLLEEGDYKMFIHTLDLEKWDEDKGDKKENDKAYFARIKELYKTHVADKKDITRKKQAEGEEKKVKVDFDELVAYLCAEKIEKESKDPFSGCEDAEKRSYMNDLWEARQTLETGAKSDSKETPKKGNPKNADKTANPKGADKKSIKKG